MAAKAKPSATQRRILLNRVNGKPYDDGRPIGMSAAGGWDSSLWSCFRHGWLTIDCNEIIVTDAGRRALEGKE